MKRWGFLGLWFLCMIGWGWSAEEDYQSYFEQGESFYQNNQFDKAVEQYTILLDKGYENVAVWYNLGTSYVAQNHYGWAIWAFEKARLYNRSDQHVVDNLNYALDKVGLERRVQIGPVEEMLWGAVYALPWSYWALMVIGGYLLFWLTALARKLNWRLLKSYGLSFVSVFLCLFATINVSLQCYYFYTPKKGVVVAPKKVLRGGPSEGFSSVGVIPEGALCQIVQNEGSWFEVEAAGGEQGWLLSVEGFKVLSNERVIM